MRDVLWGYVTWLLVIGTSMGVMVVMTTLVGPPMDDRARTFAFIGGGAALVFLTMLGVLAVAAIGMALRN